MSSRIMVMDDSPEILDLLQDLLTEEGYAVAPCSVPVVDPTVVTQARPDLIILDLLFAGQALGWPLLQQLEQHPAMARVPVIVCTAAAHEVARHMAELEARNIPVVAKPFDVDELLAMVRAALEHGAGGRKATAVPATDTWSRPDAAPAAP